MHRLARAATRLALLAALALAIHFVVGESAADLENLVFTSRASHLKVVVPRGWRASEQANYPGVLLWMARSQPPGQIVLTSEPFTRALYCAWPQQCRPTSTEPAALASAYACSLRTKLQSLKFKVDAFQAGPKENEAAGLPSLWFEYQDNKHFQRQAVAFSHDRAISLLLSTPTAEARAAHTRAFEQALRTLAIYDEDDTATTDAGVPAPDAPVDASTLDAGPTLTPAPPPVVEPIGPCPTKR